MHPVVNRPPGRYTLFLQDYGGPLWETRRAFWADRASHEAALRENFFSPAATRLRHVGAARTQRHTIPTSWLRTYQPALLVLWGRYDPSFQAEQAEAYRRDVPGAEVHMLTAGHFALDERPMRSPG